MQLIVAQAGTNAASYWLLRDVFEAELRMRDAEDAAASHDSVPERERADVLRTASPMARRASYPLALALDTLSSALDRRRAHAPSLPRRSSTSTSEALRER